MKEKLRTLFQQKFNPKDYRKTVLENLLHAQQLLSQPQFLEETNDGDRIYGLGYLTDADGKQIGLYYTDVVSGDVRRKRVGFRQMMKSYVKYGADAAIAVFADKEHWRLSYMSDLKGGETSAKRFSYILGDPNGQYNTPVNRLALLGTQAPRLRLKDIFEAFSVETLSKEFFDGYHRHYDTICEYLTKHVEEFSIFNSQLSILHDYVKKMMGRIIFLHFLQKKGWLNGNQYFLRDLYFMSPYQADFLEQVLEPLFFGIFNTETTQRERLFADEHWDKKLLEEWKSLPYLNGGLFERDEADKLHIKLPASLFEDLFTFLASYNFTVDENDPDDAEVGVDPEMLGKIFESLLEDNKAKGAFYTPKEIVRYMCKESLIAYLVSQIDKSQSEQIENSDNSFHSDCNKANSDCDKQVRSFVEHHEFPSELEPYRDTLVSALRNVKICDPAIGSGAFPMGLLNELWRCREALAQSNSQSEKKEKKEISDNSFRSVCENEPSDCMMSRVELKKEIIENNIYGVDIERGAIDIARLRFWLSIVVDAEEPEPLPNFDYKFMQGNSLIESYKGIDLSRISNRLRGGQSKSTQLLLGLDSDFSKKNLQRLMRDYFSVTDHKQKASMRQAINDEVKHLITDFIGGSVSDLNKLDPSANQDFFLWHTWFKDIFDNGGFDIVIGNPPYIRQELLGMDYKRKLIDAYPEVGNGIADVCVYFFGLGIRILNSNGVLSFITSNKFLKTKYGKELRHTLTTKVSVDRIIDFFELPVFNASTDAGITILFKSISNNTTKYYPIKTLVNLNLTEITSGSYLTTIKNDNEWQFVEDSQSSILDKLNFNTISLKEFTNNKIFYGIKTGFNKAFVIKDKTIAQRLLNSESAPIIKKFAQSTDIQMWGLKNDNKFFIATGYDTDIECLYPTAFQYLSQFRDELESRCDKGVKFYNLRACAYYEEFEKPKLIYIHTAKDHQFYFDTEGHYINNSCYMIVTDSKFLFCFLNSKLFKYYKRLKFVAYGDGQEAGRCKLDYNKMITVPIKKNVEEKPFEELYEKLKKIKKANPNADTSSLEREIDILVYQLYNLTPEEIAIIEQSAK